MSTAPHTFESLLLPIPEFDFIFVADTSSLRSHTRPQCKERALHSNADCFDAASLTDFHEEFKSLVLESNRPSQVELLVEIFVELFDFAELDGESRVEEAAREHKALWVAATASVKPAAPRRIVRRRSKYTNAPNKAFVMRRKLPRSAIHFASTARPSAA